MPEHIVVIGAVALGPKAACRFKRLKPSARVTMIDKGDIISYGGCGIPYYVSGDVSEPMQLQSTSFHMIRDEAFFHEVKGVEAKTLVEALSIDRQRKEVHVIDHRTKAKDVLKYDKLVIATGATPRKLNLPGSNLMGVHSIANPYDAVQIRNAVTKGEVSRAVIVGAGFIGLEMAEALADMWGVETSVVEIEGQIMPRYVSPVLAGMGQRHMEEKGITFYLGETVQRFEGDGRVQRVITNKRTIEADVVVVSAGVIPNSSLAKEAGLEVSPKGGIVVNDRMQTSDPDIYSGGDCVEVKNLITNRPMYIPMGSMANRQGRVIGTNLAGGDARFPGAVGSFIVKLFETSLGGVGLCGSMAAQQGFDAVTVLLTQLDRAHFYPKKELMTLELVVERQTGRVLGMQGFGSSGDAMIGRINAVAAMMPNKPTVQDLANLETAYSPPFSSAMDIVNTLGNMAENVLAGMNRGIGPDQFAKLWERRTDPNLFFLDCREQGDAKLYLERHPDTWHNVPQGKTYDRLNEIPRDKTIVLICNTGARSYEAQIMLHEKGLDNVVNLHGGMATLKKWGGDL